jgi:isopenicillin N synthase-like dioxygenase
MEENLDIANILEKAMTLSKLFEAPQEEKEEQEENIQKKEDNSLINIENMAHMLKMFKMVSNIQEQIKEEQAKSTLYPEGDLNTPAIITIKSALPYLDYRYQMCISLAIKLIEIHSIMEKYKEGRYITSNES